MEPNPRSQPNKQQILHWVASTDTLQGWRVYDPPQPRWDRIQAVKEVVEKVVSRQLPEETLPCATEVTQAWKQSAGDFNARYSRPKGWKNGALLIDVDNAALRFELTQHQHCLLERMQKLLAPTKIKSLRFRVIG